MFAFGYALVPLYDLVCESLGINGRVKLEKSVALPTEIKPFEVTLQQLAQAVDQGWTIVAKTPKKTIMTQTKYTEVYLITNQLNVARKGRAVPSVNPIAAAGHLKKIECFCMDILDFKAKETKEVYVTFYLDKDLSPEVQEVTLAYSFFDAK
ncbi:MAG: cytochrome c oxidase assembly protein [Methylacidiphilales bacterium]|nr:cytochrome c oxidase assembly protein [Candidatus Methylacidiphilales bacterium]